MVLSNSFQPKPFDFARSSIENWEAPEELVSEAEALEIFKREANSEQDDASTRSDSPGKRLLVLDLHDFEIYRAPGQKNKRCFELISLHLFATPRQKILSLDGFVKAKLVKLYVHDLRIKDISIDGYGDDEDPGVICYLQSDLTSEDKEYDIWYRLRQPCKSYRRFHTPFLWVAQLGKHVIDFLHLSPSVGLEHFRQQFYVWIARRYGQQPKFKQWLSAGNIGRDYRASVNAYIEYIYLQAQNLPDSASLLQHPLWPDCMTRALARIQKQPVLETQTLATPGVYNLFREMYFGDKLECRNPSPHVALKQEQRKNSLGFTTSSPSTSYVLPPSSVCQAYDGDAVNVGDIVAVEPNESDKRQWKGSQGDFLAYVQDILLVANGDQKLCVIWLYRPHDTTICNAEYPYKNELFMSDNCNCKEPGWVLASEVKGKYEVKWLPSIVPTSGFFIRQTYIARDHAFVGVEDGHKICSHRLRRSRHVETPQEGTAVYYLPKDVHHDDTLLEPGIFCSRTPANDEVTILKLLRLERDVPGLAASSGRKDIAPNELVLTNVRVKLKTSFLRRTCSIKHVKELDVVNGCIPSPYNRDGAGDFWFISMELTGEGNAKNLRFLGETPSWLRAKEYEEQNCLRLKGLSIFSGGGSLDRGLELGNTVEFQTVVDLSGPAIHTQRANAKDPAKTQFYYGSVDDFLGSALEDQNRDIVPLIGEVEVLAAGSPCPGFSGLQQNKNSDQSKRNASHVTTFCSIMDLFRPQYGILENVVNMATTRNDNGQNVLWQVVACLVSLGYQVRHYIMDSWCYGSKQHRSRLIITVAAPGLTPMAQPLHTHSLPCKDTRNRSLGKTLNGQKFGERQWYSTPFTFVPAKGIDKGLPPIGNGMIQTCITHPDHRVLYLPKYTERARVQYIPRTPAGSGYKVALDLDRMPKGLKKVQPEIRLAYCRIKADGLVPTITTGVSMRDARNGAVVHWSEHRSISLMEARRTQGYPDDEVVIGRTAEQYAVVGNAVDRSVAFALGLELQRAVVANAKKGRSALVRSGTAKKKQSISTTVVEVDEDDEAIMVVGAPSTTGLPRENHSMIIKSATQMTTTFPILINSLSHSSRTLAAEFRKITSTTTTSGLPIPADASAPTNKRRRETVIEHESSSETICDQPQYRKRPKRRSTLQINYAEDLSTQASSLASESWKARRTRHSGLEVDYVPKQWDKTVEAELRGKRS